MDLVFIEGVAAVVSGIIVFVGTVWLLLTVIMGARLAYFVTASVALAFIFIMTLVWSFGTPLGPVGQLPDWSGVGLAESADQIEFDAASEYPEGSWAAPAEDDTAANTKAAELESAAINYLEGLIPDGKGGAFVTSTDAFVVADSTRLLKQGDTEYGALQLEASTGAVAKAKEADPDQTFTPEDATAIVVMKYDPGNPLGKARKIAAGTFLLWAAHLFGLSRAERKTKKKDNGNGEATR
ncbi:MAG: hypothetical protein QOG04_535 [Actinomycetota bacterium]|jgi:hypothetical protein|nr:hypothetical protein [Actinomycetota bacterium]